MEILPEPFKLVPTGPKRQTGFRRTKLELFLLILEFLTSEVT